MKTAKIIILTALAYLLAIAVVLSSTHLRDIIANNNSLSTIDVNRPTKAQTEDVSAKAIGELHNHVEKTMLKSFVKSVGDQATIARTRHTLEDFVESDHSFAVMLMETILMFRLAFAFSLAR